jgi:hypothetical protein
MTHVGCVWIQMWSRHWLVSVSAILGVFDHVLSVPFVCIFKCYHVYAF